MRRNKKQMKIKIGEENKKRKKPLLKSRIVVFFFFLKVRYSQGQRRLTLKIEIIKVNFIAVNKIFSTWSNPNCSTFKYSSFLLKENSISNSRTNKYDAKNDRYNKRLTGLRLYEESIIFFHSFTHTSIAILLFIS